MKVGILKVRIDLKTRKRISEEIIGEKEIDEDEYYRPLVKILGDDFLRRFNSGEYSTEKREQTNERKMKQNKFIGVKEDLTIIKK